MSHICVDELAAFGDQPLVAAIHENVVEHPVMPDAAGRLRRQT